MRFTFAFVVLLWHCADRQSSARCAAVAPDQSPSLLRRHRHPAETRPSFAEWLDGVRAEALSSAASVKTSSTRRSRDVDGAAAGRHRTRSRAGRDRPVARELHQAPADRRRSCKRGRDAYRPVSADASTRCRRSTACPRASSPASGASNRTSADSAASVRRSARWRRWPGIRGARPSFERELFDALEILNRGDIELSRLKGSWAGAMGQPQFMPSSYLQYAAGLRRRWPPRHLELAGDIFASIANYLRATDGSRAKLGPRGQDVQRGRGSRSTRPSTQRTAAVRPRAT